MKRQISFLLLAILFILHLTGCDGTTKQTGNLKEEVKVFVSILPQADFVKKIGGEQVEVSVMIPPGASPASYEPTTGQLKELSDADLYLMIGHVPFEDAWMDRIKSTNPDMLVADTSAGITLMNNNPHIWLSPRLVKVQAENICQALIQVDPDNKEYYKENTSAFISELETMDTKIKEILSDIHTDKFLVYHPAWGYFACDYGLKEIAIEQNGKEPAAGELSRIVSAARENNIKVIFVSPQHSTQSAEAVAEELGVKVEFLDPLPEDYGYLLQAAEILGKAMK